MKKGKERAKIIKELLDITDKEFTDEELIQQLTMTEIVENNSNEKTTFGQKAADAVAKFAGSWAFIFSFVAVMVIWMIVNVVLSTKAFDAYPFILLNLVLSCIAAVQAPLIMMSQNRQEVKDRKRAENDYKINLKNELIIDDLHKKIELILENQKKILKELDNKENNKND
ncbi:predicted membrane protein [Firmicutes bacterium CAG:313]|jgi:predicted membrane protein|nr:predicted membrane protein [Firmicutes bacterium CAG:313]